MSQEEFYVLTAEIQMIQNPPCRLFDVYFMQREFSHTLGLTCWIQGPEESLPLTCRWMERTSSERKSQREGALQTGREAKSSIHLTNSRRYDKTMWWMLECMRVNTRFLFTVAYCRCDGCSCPWMCVHLILSPHSQSSSNKVIDIWLKSKWALLSASLH